MLIDYKQGHKQLFTRILYCPKCRVLAYKTHKCSSGRLISITTEMRDIVDKITDLGIRVNGASCYVREHTIQGLCLEYLLIAEVHLEDRYPEAIMNDMPEGWAYHTQTVSADHWPISMLLYTTTGCWYTYEAMERQIKAVMTRFIAYLDTKDRYGLRAVLTLMDF